MRFIFNKIFNIIQIEKIKKVPWILGSHAFSIILILVLLDLILGEFLLYKYALLVKKEEPKITENIIKFEYSDYQKILEEWQAREQKFKEFSVEKYSNPFKFEVIEPKNSTESENSIDLK